MNSWYVMTRSFTVNIMWAQERPAPTCTRATWSPGLRSPQCWLSAPGAPAVAVFP